ncbi:MAG TPA: ABC transporter ATP-binding protein [Gemmatimonadales bacterium]|nr:ABC transporter ATP-binding protein [Gemmatimonadales bacterium]
MVLPLQHPVVRSNAGGRRRPDDPPSTWRERLRAIRHLPRLLRLVWDTEPRYVVGILMLRVARSLVPLGVLWVGKLIVDEVVTGIALAGSGAPVPWIRLAELLAIELAIALGGEALSRVSALLESLLGDLFANRTSVELMRHAATLDLEQFENAEVYDKLERARRQTVGRIGLFTLLLSSIQDAITLVTLSVALAVYVPWLLVLLAVAVLPSLLGETHFASLGYSLLYSWTPERRQLDYLRYIGASDVSAKELKLFGLSGFLVGRYDRLSREFYEANKALAVRRSLVSTLLAGVGTLGYYGAYAVIIYLTVTGYRSPAGLFTIGVLTFLAGSFRQSRDLIQRVLLSLSQVFEQALYLDDLFSFLALEPRIRPSDGSRPVPVPIRTGITFENVGFRYPGSEGWAVRGLEFSLAPGERIALVGENGAGKTTLVKLLARLYDPSEGRILLDGVDLREYDVDSLRRNVGVIFQDFVRYDFRLKENIAVGDIGRLEDEPLIESAAERSLADTVAARLPGRYGQMLGRRFEGGVDLSGGEWQKVALARAYMRDAQLLILDEPTAALDARAEYEVFLRFAELTAGRMAVLISHRFSTVRMADRILVLQGGHLVEQGTHEALVAQGGLYAELFHLQAAGYR